MCSFEGTKLDHPIFIQRLGHLLPQLCLVSACPRRCRRPLSRHGAPTRPHRARGSLPLPLLPPPAAFFFSSSKNGRDASTTKRALKPLGLPTSQNSFYTCRSWRGKMGRGRRGRPQPPPLSSSSPVGCTCTRAWAWCCGGSVWARARGVDLKRLTYRKCEYL